MLVLEITFDCFQDLSVQMNTNVLAVGKDKDSDMDRSEFEKFIIPQSYAIIDKAYTNQTLKKNPNLYIDMMNVIVNQAKTMNYKLDKLGQNEKYPDIYQLRFTRETDERFMGSNKGICEAI